MRKHNILIIVIIAIVSMSLIQNNNDADYLTAISLAEKTCADSKINRNLYKLIKIENNILTLPEKWMMTYLEKKCISKDGRRNCKGGEIIITVNIKTKKATVAFGE